MDIEAEEEYDNHTDDEENSPDLDVSTPPHQTHEDMVMTIVLTNENHNLEKYSIKYRYIH